MRDKWDRETRMGKEVKCILQNENTTFNAMNRISQVYSFGYSHWICERVVCIYTYIIHDQCRLRWWYGGKKPTAENKIQQQRRPTSWMRGDERKKHTVNDNIESVCNTNQRQRHQQKYTHSHKPHSDILVEAAMWIHLFLLFRIIRNVRSREWCDAKAHGQRIHITISTDSIYCYTNANKINKLRWASVRER